MVIFRSVSVLPDSMAALPGFPGERGINAVSRDRFDMLSSD